MRPATEWRRCGRLPNRTAITTSPRSMCLGRSSMSLSKLLHTILLMPAEIELTKEVRRVKLRRNPKDPEGMKKLEPALERLNELRIQHLDQKRIEFVLG